MKSFIFLIILIQASFANASGKLVIDEPLKNLKLNIKIRHEYPIVDQTTKRSTDPQIELEFGKLSLTQFDGLMNFYQNVSKVKFDPNKSYVLSDFLTPQMQALRGLDFHSDRTAVELRGFKDYMFGDELGTDTNGPIKIHSTAQCWGTAWNSIVSLQHASSVVTPFEIAFIDPDLVENYLLSDKHSISIDQSQDKKFGDLVAMLSENTKGKISPIHFGIYIGFGLVFEKEDAGSYEPYRIIPLSDSTQGIQAKMADKWQHKDEKLSVNIRRFLNVNKPLLPIVSRINPIFSEESYSYFGRASARLVFYRMSTFGGADIPAVDLITKVRFGINESGRGFIRDKTQSFFTPAYQ